MCHSCETSHHPAKRYTTSQKIAFCMGCSSLRTAIAAQQVQFLFSGRSRVSNWIVALRLIDVSRPVASNLGSGADQVGWRLSVQGVNNWKRGIPDLGFWILECYLYSDWVIGSRSNFFFCIVICCLRAMNQSINNSASIRAAANLDPPR